ncbi:hypothetical protein Patl1_06915 [Pistacia atlantica]|uniref:Uncharacterized protein n=1 Tax=Pistacia atlantica TaxID=434234 RepID=A0ACC1AIV9_9ROSI|nr:hypothetical protein Patl1_06915 [Pistacia atlantica]
MISQWFRSVVKSLTVYKFEDLQIATENFSQYNRIKVSTVYKGSLKGDNIAIKVMQGDVFSEINILQKINHSNILRLSGFCGHDSKTYLVYEWAENGSLSDWLHSKQHQTSITLQWNQRVQIAYDVANAMNYLHKYTTTPYIHKNLKTSNILLDANFRAKISNFGLARSVDKCDQSELQWTWNIVGNPGYMAPEYSKNGVVTPKLDIFALGAVILELLSGRDAATGGTSEDDLLSGFITGVLEGVGNTREKLRGFIDPSLRNEYPLDLAFSMAQLARNCVDYDLNARASMSELFITLSKILQLSDWYPYDSMSISSVR